MELYLAFMLVGFSMTSYKIYKKKLISADKNIDVIIKSMSTGFEASLFFKVLAAVSVFQFIVLGINYSMFYAVVGNLAVLVGMLSFICRLYTTCFSLGHLKEFILRSKKPFSRYSRFMNMNIPASMNFVYIDTFVIFYTLIHI